MGRIIMEKQYTIQQMQNWNKRFKLEKEDARKVIDTFDDGEIWTIHENEAYNLCILLNQLNDENQNLKKELDKIYQTATTNKIKEIIDKIYDDLLYETTEKAHHKREGILTCLEAIDTFGDEIQ